MKTKDQIIYLAKMTALELTEEKTIKNKHLEKSLQTELRVLCDILDDDLPEWLSEYIEKTIDPWWL
ncbi:hypothetical protein [Allobaculum stercoricanis]|uniref:hypothetical protein n=1 Tax=Allobaculum stercoricanis TaxID=174709 RepID=UPI002942A9D1|nr:hypothetical protein [Allobaculum stercoricanis]